MRFLFGLATLVLLAPAAAAAQRPPAIVTGRVMILDSARAGAGVLVTIESVNFRRSTDSTGHYRLEVPATQFADGDSVTMMVTRVGLRPELRRLQLTAGTSIPADFGLKTQDLDALVCDGIFSVPPATAHLPRIYHYKMCRMTHALPRKVRGRSPAPTTDSLKW